MNYSEYLHLDKILGAQQRLSPDEHDEMLFITTHQSYELWFKQVLFEGEFLKQTLYGADFYSSLKTIGRILVILKSLVKKVDILETMSPLSFLGFRDRLANSSGLQSAQFRMLECFLGFKNRDVLQQYVESDPQRRILLHYMESSSVYDALLNFLNANGCQIPSGVLRRDVTQTYEENTEVEAALAVVYRSDPRLAMLCEKFVDFDEGVLEWRYRHVRMVERTIGTKTGTGGSLGVPYLQATLRKRAFPELWKIRSAF